MSLRLPGVVAAFSLTATVAYGQPTTIWMSPTFVEEPSKADIVEAMPKATRGLGDTPFVALTCSLQVTGRITDCRVDRESHPQRGLAKAALSLTPLYRVHPRAAERHQGEGVAFRILFGEPWRQPPPPVLSVPPVPVRAPPAPPILAPPAPPRRPVVTKPDWERKPTGADVRRVYPKAAAKAGIGGRVTLSCAVLANGSLSACSVVSEDPADAGFGDAALRLQPKFKMSPMTPDGRPVQGGTVRIPLTFTISQ